GRGDGRIRLRLGNGLPQVAQRPAAESEPRHPDVSLPDGTELQRVHECSFLTLRATSPAAALQAPLLTRVRSPASAASPRMGHSWDAAAARSRAKGAARPL